jgi:Fur family ferric uptake transcriptional regulator
MIFNQNGERRDARRIGPALSAKGLRLTAPRRAVVEVVGGMRYSLTPREIHARARKRHSRLGLVTVYRTLEILVEAGVVCRIHREDGCHRYAPAPTAHSHHLICPGCNQVMEFDGCDLDALLRRVARQTGYRIEGHWLELFGLCPRCQS